MSHGKCDRSCCALILVAITTIGVAASSTAALDWSGRVCYMGDSISVWVEWNFVNVFGSYDPVTHAGRIDYNTDGPFNPSDFQATIPDAAGGLITLQGGQDNVMGSFEVLDGLGTGQCTLSTLSLWVSAGGWRVHLILSAGSDLTTTMPLTGFTATGEGLYSAVGLDIPIQYEVIAPDGTAIIVPDVLRAIEFRSPLELSAPVCFADQDQNGIFDLTDVNLFIQGFLSQCDSVVP